MEQLPDGLLPLWYALACEHKAFQVEAREFAPYAEAVAAELARIGGEK